MKLLNKSIEQNPDRWFNIAMSFLCGLFGLVIILTIILSIKLTWAEKEVQKSQVNKTLNK